jgi:hypothetical protein
VNKRLKENIMSKLIKSAFNLLGAAVLLVSFMCALGFAQDKFPTGKYAVGEFTVNFGSDGTTTVSRQGEVMVEGVYSVTKDEITLTDKRGPMACIDAGPGKFQWKFDGKALTLKTIEDNCGGRASALTSQPLVKKNE